MLKLNLSSVNLYNQLRSDIIEDWKTATTNKGCVTLYQNIRDRIAALDSSNDEPSEDEIDAGHAAVLHQLNVKLQRERLNALTSSHSPATIEASKNTTTAEKAKEPTMSNATAINIDSMTLQELAALQLQIAQRINELTTNLHDKPRLDEVAAPNQAAVDSGDEYPLMTGEQMAEQAKQEQVRSKKFSSNIQQRRVKQQATTTTTAAAAPKPELPRISTLSYKELQKEISRITKASPEAKAIAAKYAKECGKKSWSTTGASGYAAIYKLVSELA